MSANLLSFLLPFKPQLGRFRLLRSYSALPFGSPHQLDHLDDINNPQLEAPSALQSSVSSPSSQKLNFPNPTLSPLSFPILPTPACQTKSLPHLTTLAIATPSGPPGRSPSASLALPKSSHVSFETLSRLHRNKTPITMLTAHDFQSARLLAMSAASPPSPTPGESHWEAGVDVCLCGDSLAMVALGYNSTTQLTLGEYISHLRAVRRGLDSTLYPPPGWPQGQPYNYRIPLLLADLPFGTYEGRTERGLRTSLSLLAAAQIDAVKIEGGLELVPLVRTLSDYGMPVIAHIGLLPQRTAGQGGMRVQGSRAASAARAIVRSALQLEAAGAVGLLLEAVPDRLAAAVRERVKIFVIGIGAGSEVDGQVLVTSDLLGSLDGTNPRFVLRPPTFQNSLDPAKPAWDLGLQTIKHFVKATRSRTFPDPNGKHSYKMNKLVLQELDTHGWL